MVDDSSIPAPLTSEPGDPARGRDLAVKRKLGNCLACHVMPIPEQSFHGETGPDLNGVGGRYTAAELRLQIVDSKAEATRRTLDRLFQKHAAAALAYSGGASSVTVS